MGSLPLTVSLSVSFYCYLFSLLFFFKVFVYFSFAHALEIWVVIVHSAVTKNSLHMPDDVRAVVSCWPLLFTLGGITFVATHDQFSLFRIHPLQVVQDLQGMFTQWFMSLTGSF